MNESGQKFNSSYSNNSFYCSTNNIINNNTLGILFISYVFATNKVILIDNCIKYRSYRYRGKTNKNGLKKSECNYINNRKNNTANCFTKDPSLFDQQQILTEEQITLYRTIIDNDKKNYEDNKNEW